MTPSITYRDRVVQLYPPASPYIKKSFEGILMYEIAGGITNKYVNYADPSITRLQLGRSRKAYRGVTAPEGAIMVLLNSTYRVINIATWFRNCGCIVSRYSWNASL